ncbi:Methyltransferase domain-containing protein [Gracilibacillus ureilyticus]|uniref:Methyltransferase domain-containing protein n=1 Tax=Gracilibacillus ureilyticus TaxID=531814 RepID=A0A1H9VUZ4_9BACI|nr:class I SAM-dependent methyltransferase [Gracilibacillus ureilyticus]SES25314.1 Methyltransferase domain-containing protein [Gracilibacillus ureilyticus]
MQKDKLIKKYDKQVRNYEKNRNNPTLAKWRRELLRDIKGNVLEVGVGAGANFAFYNKNNVHITGVDFSPEMIKSATKEADLYQLETQFLLKNVEELEFEPDSFDHIVSTLSLCSYQDPVRVLTKFNEWCRKDGSIRLLEHGISSNRFLSFTQKTADPILTKISGCHWNRDMLELVNAANIQIERVERYWSDIVYMIWAKPSL